MKPHDCRTITAASDRGRNCCKRCSRPLSWNAHELMPAAPINRKGTLPMGWRRSASALACAIMAMLSAQPLVAQDLRVSEVEIAYREPKEPALRPIYERLKKRQVLEDLQQFLSPLKLPRKLIVRLDEC